MEVQLGVRVVRGPDWEWGDQDGGEGHVGTVVEVGEPSISDGSRAAVVQWDCGERCRYRCGVEGKYDLRGFDIAPAGVFDDEGVFVCVGCGLRDIKPGFSWICCQCSCYFLCNFCYMLGKHNKQHVFCRFVDERHWSLVPQRQGSHVTEVKGLFPGAIVKRGEDWPSRKENDNSGTIGNVLAITSSKDGKHLNDIVEVEWVDYDQKKTRCRVGQDGKVDVLCVTPAKVGLYYLTHLPVLTGKTVDDSIDSSIIRSGDLVQVELDVEIFRMMQEGHGGWNDAMAELQGQIGFVHHIRDSGDLLVKYSSGNWWINPFAVVKLPGPVLLSGDTVRVTDDREKAMKAQKGFGTEWTDDILDVLGKTGQVDGADFYGVTTVIIERKKWQFNQFCLELTGIRKRDHADGVNCDLKDDPFLLSKMHALLSENDPGVLGYAAQLGNELVVREYLNSSPNEVNRIVNCKAPIHYAAQAGSITVVKTLLEFQADVNILDDMLQSALHYAMFCPKIRTSGEIIECLLDADANPNIQNIAGETPLMIASRSGCFAAVKVLANHPKCDFNIINLDGVTALFSAILSQNVQSVKLLLDGGADPSSISNIDSEEVTPLHHATKHGFTGGVEESVEHFPNFINLRDHEGKTPLHITIVNNHFHLATYLMEKPNCDINSSDNSGCTPLHVAISEGNTYLIEQLVGYGADLNVKERSGCTPLNVLVLLEISGVHATVTFHPISNKTPRLLQVRETLSKEKNDDVAVYTVIACFLIQEGADMTSLGFVGLTSSQTLAIGETISPTVIKTIRMFADKHAGTGHYHGSLRQSTSTDDTLISKEEQKSVPPSTSATKVISLCELCEEEPITVMFHPCKHSVLCELCAERATKCLKCKIPVTRKEIKNR